MINNELDRLTANCIDIYITTERIDIRTWAEHDKFVAGLIRVRFIGKSQQLSGVASIDFVLTGTNANDLIVQGIQKMEKHDLIPKVTT